MGFEPDMAQRALAKHKGDVAKAIEELVNSGGNIPSPDTSDQSPSTSSGTSNSTHGIIMHDFYTEFILV